MKITEPRLDRAVANKAAAVAEKTVSGLDATASIRRGLAQARNGKGRLAEDVLDELEQQA